MFSNKAFWTRVFIIGLTIALTINGFFKGWNFISIVLIIANISFILLQIYLDGKDIQK